MKNKTVEKLMRFLITLLGAGHRSRAGSADFTAVFPLVSDRIPLCAYRAVCGSVPWSAPAVCFAFSSAIIGRTMKLIAAIERRWDAMPTQQIVLTSIGMSWGWW